MCATTHDTGPETSLKVLCKDVELSPKSNLHTTSLPRSILKKFTNAKLLTAIDFYEDLVMIHETQMEL